MADFSDIVAKAIKPSMSREEREGVYVVVREAVMRLQDQQQLAPDDPRALLQRHLVEETIRDVEADVARYEAMRKLEAAFAAQSAANRAVPDGQP